MEINTSFDEESLYLNRWNTKLDKSNKDFLNKKKEITQAIELFNKLSSQKHSILDDVLDRKLRKCESCKISANTYCKVTKTNM